MPIIFPDEWGVKKPWPPRDEEVYLKIGDKVQILSSPGGPYGKYVIGKIGPITSFANGEEEVMFTKDNETIAHIIIEKDGKLHEISSFVYRLKKVSREEAAFYKS